MISIMCGDYFLPDPIRYFLIALLPLLWIAAMFCLYQAIKIMRS